MGTRNMTVVIANDEIKVAQYCQWDGYPSGQGSTVHSFIKEYLNGDEAEVKRKAYKELITALGSIGEEQRMAEWVKAGAKEEDRFVSSEIAAVFKKNNPHLSRDTGALILKMIADGLTDVEADPGFLADGLMCEWAYVLDMDNNNLEVYSGFDEEERPGRFAHMKLEGNKYWPVSLLHTYSFDDLPNLHDFCEELEQLNREKHGYDEEEE